MNTLETMRYRRRAPRAGTLLPLACALLVTGGCTPRIDFKRVTYEALRREDCRLNQIDQFCQRNFSNDYAEYQRLRRDFIRDAFRRRVPVKPDGETR